MTAVSSLVAAFARTRARQTRVLANAATCRRQTCVLANAATCWQSASSHRSRNERGGGWMAKSRKPKPEGRSGPELLSEVLARLFTARGWGRRQDRLHLERAWAEAVGPEFATQTRVVALRR